jgi:hypothetical protein
MDSHHRRDILTARGVRNYGLCEVSYIPHPRLERNNFRIASQAIAVMKIFQYLSQIVISLGHGGLY